MCLKSDNLQYNTLVCWDKWLINQVSNVPSIIFFFMIACKNGFNVFSYFFIDLQKSKQRVLSAQSLKEIKKKKKQCVEYQMLGQRVICPSEPVNSVLYCRLSEFYMPPWLQMNHYVTKMRGYGYQCFH